MGAARVILKSKSEARRQLAPRVGVTSATNSDHLSGTMKGSEVEDFHLRRTAQGVAEIRLTQLSWR
jgi:hypothetical protein